MKHQNFFQFVAKDEEEAGFILGELFKDELSEILEYYQSLPDWRSRVNCSLPYLSATKKAFPLVYSELVGQSKGAQIDLQQLWAIVIEDELDDYFFEKCTTMVTNNGLLIGHNEDWDPQSSDYITILKKTVRGVTTLELYYIATLGGNSFSINSNGFVQAVNTLDHKFYQVGVPRTIFSKVLSNTTSVVDDLKKYEHIKRASGFHQLIISPQGRCFSIESTADEYLLKYPKLPFVHTNHYQSDLKKYENTKNVGGTFKRLQAGKNLLKPIMNNDELKSVLNNQADGPKESIFNEKTIAKALIDLKEMKMEVWLLRESQKGWISYPLDFLTY
ncbi:MAG: hypothetical protein ISR65_16790 [Bacteriovoracaceae bacterium]|nr:hypothetical protein [Bacteriovoracaceae bacterium]